MDNPQSPLLFAKINQRGVSMSVFACGAIMVLLILAGLVVDGAAQLAAHQRANTGAAQVARFAMDAAAPYLADGQDGRTVALAAAWANAAQYDDLAFSITLDGSGALHIDTATSVRTVFLTLIGIPTLSASGHAVAVVFEP